MYALRHQAAADGLRPWFAMPGGSTTLKSMACSLIVKDTDQHLHPFPSSAWGVRGVPKAGPGSYLWFYLLTT